MTRAIDRRVTGVLALVCFLLIANAVVAYRNVRQLNEDAGWVEHTHEVKDNVKEVTAHLRAAVGKYSEFMTTGDAAALAEFRANAESAKKGLGAIAALTSDNRRQQEAIQELQRRLLEVAASWDLAIARRQQQGPPPSDEPVVSDQNRKRISEVDRLLSDMDGRETDLLVDRRQTNQRSYTTAIVSGFLTAILGLAAIAMLAWVVIRSLRARHEAAAAIHEQRQFLQATLISIGDAVIATDAAGKITFLNAVATELTGWQQKDAVGQSLEAVFQIVNENTRKSVDNPATRALRDGKIVGLANHTVLIAKDGTERPIDDSAAPIRDENGAVTGAVLVFRDITERRRIEKETTARAVVAARLAAIVESSDDAIMSKTLDGVIQSWNNGAERLFGYSSSEAIGRHISLLIPPERFPEEDTIISRIRSGDRIDHFDTVRRARDGREVAVSLSVSPIKDQSGTIVGASKIARDVTERKQLEERLRLVAADLSDANRLKDEFLATLAHELRNPLAPISNSLSLLQLSAGDAEIVRTAGAVMERQLKQLVRLVDDLLDVSRISRGTISLRREQVELSEIVASAVETTRPLIDQMGHELIVTLPPVSPTLAVDSTRLSQVLQNLLNNAAKYTPAGGRIELTASHSGSSVTISIRDNGIGIPVDQLEHIFRLFVQVDQNSQHQYGGLGIGLSLVKRLVEMHAGKVEARSAGPGTGAEFVIALPDVVLQPNGSTADDVAQEPQAIPPRRVLVVDDNKDSATTLAIMLRRQGHDVRTAFDGEEAFSVASEFRPDLVLLDIGLPKQNGYEVCKRIRASDWGKEIKVVAQTGWGQEEDQRRSQEAGFNAHLVKPIQVQQVFQWLR